MPGGGQRKLPRGKIRALDQFPDFEARFQESKRPPRCPLGYFDSFRGDWFEILLRLSINAHLPF